MSETKELVHPHAEGFVEKVTPKKPGESQFFFKCTRVLPKKENDPPPPEPDYPLNIDTGDPYRTPSPPAPTCGNIHYRHAGYVMMFLPYMKPGGQKEVIKENHNVMVCTKCKACYAWDGSQMFDVTDQVDLNAWEATEKEMHKATGPGGQC